MKKGSWSMEKVLIADSTSYNVTDQVRSYLGDSGELKRVTVFFDNSNFLLTQYQLMSPWVHMVLEFENREIQIEPINCGYVGAGPNASIRLMKTLGLSEWYIEPLFYGNTALSFAVEQDRISQLNTYQLFYEKQSSCYYKKEALKNQIKLYPNVDVKIEERLVRMYNPQRTNWMGFLNLLNYMDNIQMEYYIGDSSPLDNGLSIMGGTRSGFENGIDIKGTIHSNLYLKGDNFSVSCLIDREYEMEVIEAVYLALTGKKLSIEAGRKKASWIKRILHQEKEQEVYDKILINDVRKG